MRLRLAAAGLMLLSLPAHARTISSGSSFGTAPSAAAAAIGPLAELTAPVDLAVDADSGGESLFLGVSVNGQDQAKPFMFLRRRGRLYVRPSDLALLRIRPPAAWRAIQNEQAYAPLSAWPQIGVTLDESRQVVQLTVPADLFEASALAVTPPTGGGGRAVERGDSSFS